MLIFSDIIILSMSTHVQTCWHREVWFLTSECSVWYQASTCFNVHVSPVVQQHLHWCSKLQLCHTSVFWDDYWGITYMSAMLLRLICKNKNKQFLQTTLQTHTVLSAFSFNFCLTDKYHYAFYFLMLLLLPYFCYMCCSHWGRYSPCVPSEIYTCRLSCLL